MPLRASSNRLGSRASRIGRCGARAADVVCLTVDTSREKTIVVTGSSSSIGLCAARSLVSRNDCHVIMACRNVEKAENAAQTLQFPEGSYSVIPLDLARLDSVREFVDTFEKGPYKGLNAVVCNAATWHPRDKEARVTVDGYDETVQVNHLGHFLLVNLLLPKLKDNKGRVVFIGTETHDPDAIAGKIPPQANLGDLEGMVQGFKSPPRTIDGKKFEPTKAYKDSKVCNILTMMEMNRRFAKDGVTVSAVFPGCIAESELFREKRGWFRWLFPKFQKYITRQYVSVEEAGRRVSLLAVDPQFTASGQYWQWRGSYLRGTAETAPTPIKPTEREASKADKLWDLSAQLVGLEA